MGFLKWLFNIQDEPVVEKKATRHASIQPTIRQAKQITKPKVVKKKSITRANTRSVYIHNNNYYYYDYDGCLMDSLGNLIVDAMLLGSIMSNDNVVPDYDFPQDVIYESPEPYQPTSEPEIQEPTPEPETQEPAPEPEIQEPEPIQYDDPESSEDSND
jgi:hypothetical protein